MSNMIQRRAVLGTCSRILMDAAREAWLPDELWHKLKEELCKLPVIEAQNIKTATWERDGSFLSAEKHKYVCSKCGWWIFVKADRANGTDWAQYCPHCGARMNGGRECDSSKG